MEIIKTQKKNVRQLKSPIYISDFKSRKIQTWEIFNMMMTIYTHTHIIIYVSTRCCLSIRWVGVPVIYISFSYMVGGKEGRNEGGEEMGLGD